MKITDGHAHIWYNKNDINAISNVFKEIMGCFDYESLHFLSVPHHGDEGDLAQNMKCLYLKDKLSSYASAGLEHSFDENDTREKFGKQAELYHKLGFDGYKMLEGKPGLRKKTNISLDSPIYWDFYEYAESNGIPIVMHMTDPESFWDINEATPYQIQQGWVYDESYQTKEEICKEVWGIMKNFPKLKLTLAHFGFLYYDKKLTAEFFEKWENTCFDLVINDGAMSIFKEDFLWWNKFFEEHKTRFIFGTDLYPFDRGDKSYEEILPRTARIKGYVEAMGNDLIYFENHKKRYGKPKKINYEMALDACEKLLEREKKRLTAENISDIKIIKKYFGKGVF